MAKKKSSMFSGRTARSMEKSRSNYGYLKLPEDVNVFKPEGSTEVVFDIVPYRVSDPNHMDNKKHAEDAVAGELWWKRPLKVHRDVGPEGVSVICPTTIGERCPICEYGSKRRKEGAEWDELKDIFPKDRTLFLIVPVDAQECDVDYTEGEVHVMEQSDHTFTNFLLEEVNRDVDNDNFPDPYDGLSIQVYWRNKKIGKNKFAEASKIDFVSRDEQYDDDFLETLPCLDDILTIKSYKELEALYFGMEDMDGEDVDEEELEDEPPRRQRKTASRRTERESSSRSRREKSPPREEEEEEPEEEEEEKPTRRRTPPAKKRSRTEPEEEPEEEGEEPEEKPKRPSKPARKAPSRAPREEPEDDAEDASTEKPKRGSKVKEECPYGHEFGTDNDEFDDCDKCKVWQNCRESK